MYDNFNMEYFYYRVPGETREECWQSLSDYMEENAKWRLIYLREPPVVISEKDYDTKQEVHRGYVRFYAGPKLKDSDTLNIPTIGSLKSEIN